ncbi:MAG: glycosyltransferase family 2 protein [Lachnospiraceae bacterium]|nr:glycosyltransferase family 2 protein [Lachnospiraceae bacterium]
MEETKVTILLTCHERKEQTKACLNSLLCELPGYITPEVVAVDAGSRDGSREMLEAYPVVNGSVKLICRGPELFWNGGMRVAMNYAARYCSDSDYILLVNDDVFFYPGAMEKLIRRQKQIKADAVVGATCDRTGAQSYGGVRLTSRFLARFALIPPSEEPEQCDTFNCNCLLLTGECFLACGNLDKAYVHSMGDYDYGLRLKRAGRIVVNTAGFIGECDDNDSAGSWKDKSLPRKRRLELKEGPKGLPRKDWFHFICKNYSLPAALYHSITPYIRIILGI